MKNGEYIYKFPVKQMAPVAGDSIYMDCCTLTSVYVSTVEVEVVVEDGEVMMPYIYVHGYSAWELYTDSLYPSSILKMLINKLYSGEECVYELLRQDPNKRVSWTEQGMQDANKASLETGVWLSDLILKSGLGTQVEY